MRTSFTVIAAVALTASAGLFGAAPDQAKTAPVPMTVYKSPTCGCCRIWMTHLRARGFKVESTDFAESQLRVIKIEEGVPANLQTCHTAKVGGYLVEGHVPAEDVQRLLREKPQVAGIAVAGMPVGSPGMEQGARKDPFDTIAFTKSGKQTIFAKH